MSELAKNTIKHREHEKEYIEDYWTKRSGSFRAQREAELHSEKYFRWEKELCSQLQRRTGLKILDIGCGTGFFSILLSRHGHEMTGIDLTEEMIHQAHLLSKEEDSNAEFHAMDAENLEFADGTFDAIVTRNLTWTLPHPERAYEEWIRVLKPGGVLLNYDAEYAKDHHHLEMKEMNAHKDLPESLLDQCHEIYHMLDISTMDRPSWDKEILQINGCYVVDIDLTVGERIYKEKDMFYTPVPMFRIRAEKTEE